MLRDNADLWEDERALRLLRAWPLGDERTRRDVESFIEMIARLTVDTPDPLNGALDALNLPVRRRERLVRAIGALLQSIQADEATREAVFGDLGEPSETSPDR